MLGNERNKSVFENIFRIPKTKKEKQRAIILLVSLLVFFTVQKLVRTDGTSIRTELRNLDTSMVKYCEVYLNSGSNSDPTLLQKIDKQEGLMNFTDSFRDTLDWKPNHPIIDKSFLISIYNLENEILSIRVVVLTSDNENAYIYLPDNKSFSYQSKNLMSWLKKENFVP